MNNLVIIKKRIGGNSAGRCGVPKHTPLNDGGGGLHGKQTSGNSLWLHFPGLPGLDCVMMQTRFFLLRSSPPFSPSHNRTTHESHLKP